MAKKEPQTSGTQLAILGVSIRRPAFVPAHSRDGLALMDLYIEVQNTGNHALYVWTNRLAYDYDVSKHVLFVYLSQPEDNLPPNIEMLSDHPRTPSQSVVDPKSRVTIEVRVPAFTRRMAYGRGPGNTLAEDPIGQIDRVEVHVQYGTSRIQYRIGEHAADFRKRLMAHGAVVTAQVAPTIEKEN
jgi:hypothetical protein